MDSTTPEQEALLRIEQRKDLFLSAAKNLLAHRDAGRKCDPEAIKWAEWVVKVVEGKR